MKKAILHFSQDFTVGKTQLGGYSRILNICRDENHHIIFSFGQNECIFEERWIGNILVVLIPLGGKKFSKLNQFFLINKAANKIIDYLILKKIEPEILFGHSQLFNGFVLNSVNKRLKVKRKLIWEANVIWGIHDVKGIKGIASNLLNRFLQKRIYSIADFIVAQTEASCLFITSFYEVPVSKITIIQNAVNTRISGPSSNREFISNKIPRVFRILFCGLFDSMNGVPFWVDFIRKHQMPEYEFIFIGDGLFRAQVEELANEGKCCYLGSLAYEKMPVEYSKYDFIIIPRLAQLEADLFIPTKLVEGMFYGLIPICSRVKSMEQVVKHNVNGFIFEPEDAETLFTLLEEIKNLPNEKLLSVSLESSKTIIKDYNWEKNYRKLNDIYETCLR